MAKIYVIGIGYRPADKRVKEIIFHSDIILASQRLLDVFKGYEEFEMVRGKIEAINDVNATINFMRSQILNHQSQTITLLASGDPMFFGIGRRIIEEFGKGMVEIFPDLSSIQVAFSKIKEAWDDAFFMTLHGGPDPQKRRKLRYEINDIPSLLAEHNKIAILTDKVNNPPAIAKEILNYIRTAPQTVIARSVSDEAIPKHKIASPAVRNDNIKMYVCEKLGYPDETITEGTPERIAQMDFSDPNVVIIITK